MEVKKPETFSQVYPKHVVIMMIFENMVFSKITLNTVRHPRHNCSIGVINDRRVDFRSRKENSSISH